MTKQTRQSRERIVGLVGKLMLKKYPIGSQLTYRLSSNGNDEEIVAIKVDEEHVEIISGGTLFETGQYEGNLWNLGSEAREKFIEKYSIEPAMGLYRTK